MRSAASKLLVSDLIDSSVIMDSDEDTQLFMSTEESSSPAQQRKLKRLKKSNRVSNDPVLNESDDGFSISMPDVSYSQGLGDSDDPMGLSELPVRSESEGFEEGNELNSGFGGLGFDEELVGPKRGLEFDSMAEEELDGRVVDGSGNNGDENGDTKMESEKKKRRGVDGSENKEKKKKKKSVRRDGDGDDDDGKLNKKMAAKERRAHLIQLRSESQRLLRETRDASFKPVPLVQKPISSILEKIRQRKVEILKKSVILNNHLFDDYNDNSFREVSLDPDPETFPIDERGDDRLAKAGSKETIVQHVNMESSLDVSRIDAPNQDANKSSHEYLTSQMVETKQTFRVPVDDSQDLFSDSQTSDTNNEQSDELPDSPLEEVLAPSLLAMNLKLDSVPLDDDSSAEEDNDKENINPHPCTLASPKGDPVKAFLDDEAVEEDDSDNDLFRFQEKEDDEDNIDAEELCDMIAPGYKEKQIDTERRNELHQKWLEKQDADGTENLLQKLKCGSKQREMPLLEEEDGEEEVQESGEEDEIDLVPTNSARMNLKKVKQMIPQMFCDKNDAYISSDDEETEERLVKQCMIEKTEKKIIFMSPAEDESSREVFGLIKKLNIVPETKKKPKTSSRFDMPLTRGNTNNSFKSSFIGRGSNCSLPLFQKNGPSKVRSFIFEREDSNSRSTLSTSEESSDMIQREKKPTRNASAKFSNSQQQKCSMQKTTASEMNSGTSLFEILRHSSVSSDKSKQDRIVSQTEAIYASFKLPRKQQRGNN